MMMFFGSATAPCGTTLLRFSVADIKLKVDSEKRVGFAHEGIRVIYEFETPHP